MPIDYSKWDKLELSDDSDIEVHPNVDKKSFIRWKQQDIHQKREERKNEIKMLEQQLEMYKHLNKRMDYVLGLQKNDKNAIQVFMNLEDLEKLLNANFDKLEKCEGDRIDKDIPPYNAMVCDLVEQFHSELKRDDKFNLQSVLMKIIEHRAKIERVSEEANEKLCELYKERELHISSEDMKDAWNSSIINKGEPMTNEEITSVKSQQSKKQDLKALGLKKFISYSGEENLLKLDDKTLKFGDLSCEDHTKGKGYLMKNYEILSAQQVDALMMSSFSHELQGDSKKCYNVIYQSEVMSSIVQIYELRFKNDSSEFIHVEELQDIIMKFYMKLDDTSSSNMARPFFLSEVEKKYAHVKTRSVAMREEDDDKEGQEIIQLKSVEPNTELRINVPAFKDEDETEDEVEKHRIQLFNMIPERMRDALLSGSLDKVNEVFASMSLEDGEQMLEIFNAGGFLGIEKTFENQEEFEEYQKTLHKEENH
ncbi:hypothetical protein ACO0R3_002820 [Hanseniaspora guilliermondii]